MASAGLLTSFLVSRSAWPKLFGGIILRLLLRMAKVCVVVALSWLPYFTERLSFGCPALSSEIAFSLQRQFTRQLGVGDYDHFGFLFVGLTTRDSSLEKRRPRCSVVECLY